MGFAPKTYNPTTTESSGNSRYLRIKKGEGDRRVRILSNPFDYYVYWTSDRKKVTLVEPPAEMPMDIKEGDRVNLTWAVVVLDRSDNKIKIWEITQKTIRMALVELSEDEDWGHPSGYDIKIKRSDESDKTSYLVTPAPRTPIDGVTMNLLMANPINLNAMLTGADPFKGPHSHLPEELGVAQPAPPPVTPQYTPPAPAVAAPQPAVARSRADILKSINDTHLHMLDEDKRIVFPKAMSAIGKPIQTKLDDLTDTEFDRLADEFLIAWGDSVKIVVNGLEMPLFDGDCSQQFIQTMAMCADEDPWKRAKFWANAVSITKSQASPQPVLAFDPDSDPPF